MLNYKDGSAGPFLLFGGVNCRAVARAVPDLPIIADMPYGSFHVSEKDTVQNALRLVKEAGVSAVKIEGGTRRESVIKALLNAEIPVMGHLGLTPQSLHKFGGYKVQGRDPAAADLLLDDAAFLAQGGCFAMVLECIPASLAARISSQLTIPTIGIGAGVDCDGQVLVWHDLLGLFDGIRPKFVKRFAELGREAVEAISDYAQEVRSGTFPGVEHSYSDKITNKEDRKPVEDGNAPAQGYLTSMDNDES